MVMSGCFSFGAFGNPDALNNQYNWVKYGIRPGLKGEVSKGMNIQLKITKAAGLIFRWPWGGGGLHSK